MGETIVIKGVDEDAYRRLKSKAAREGLRIGEAASMAFRAWARQGSQRRLRDDAKMRMAAESMDNIRSKLKKLEGWSSVKVIREWRQTRRTSS